MKISVIVNEIVDGAIDFVSLVKNGANRSPWKIIKMEQPAPSWMDHMPEFAKLAKQLAASESVTKENTTVILKNVIADMNAGSEPVQKSDQEKIRKMEIAKLRHKLNGLNNQQLGLWEQPTHPMFKKLDDDLSFAIHKAELELAILNTDQQEQQMVGSSAFFRRGGVSIRADASLYDSADNQRAGVSKSVETIDLSPINTQADFNRIKKADDGVEEIDLNPLKF